MGEQKYNWALDGGEWSASSPYHFTSRGRSPRYLLDKGLGRREENLGAPGNQTAAITTPTEISRLVTARDVDRNTEVNLAAKIDHVIGI
jgi:hypothetical protein